MANALALLAGDSGYSAYLLEGRNKSLLEFDSELLIDRTLRAIDGTSSYDTVVVVGPPAVLQRVPERLAGVRVIHLQQQDSVAANLLAVFDTLRALSDTPPRVVVMTNDAPLVGAAELDGACRAFDQTRSGMVAFVSRVDVAQLPEAFDRAYRRSMVPLTEGPFVLSNLFGLTTDAVALLQEIDVFFRLRKQASLKVKLDTLRFASGGFGLMALITWLKIVVSKAIWTMRPSSTWPFRLSASLAEIQTALNRAFGSRTRVSLLIAEYNAMCWDVDTPQQLKAIRGVVADSVRHSRGHLEERRSA